MTITNEELGLQAKTDHDLIVVLNVKMDSLTHKVNEITDGTTTKLLNHENRIEALEVLTVKYPATELVPRFFKLEQEVHDFKTSAVAWRTVTGALGGGVFYALSQLPTWIKIFK